MRRRIRTPVYCAYIYCVLCSLYDWNGNEVYGLDYGYACLRENFTFENTSPINSDCQLK